MQVGDAPRFSHLAWHLMTHDLGQVTRDMEQFVQINARVVAHGVEHVNGVFAANIATGPGA